MTDTEPHTKKNPTYFPTLKKKKKKNPNLPTHSLNSWLGNYKQTIF